VTEPVTGAADPGLFGPASVTWRVAREPALLVAGVRALLQQSLHPVVAEGFRELSAYRDQPWRRLTRTAEFVGLVTFATTEEARVAARRVRSGHARQWRDARTGRVRRLDDPDLQLWVHACMVDSFLDTAVRSGLRLSPAEQDRYVAEQVRFAALIGLEETTVPADRAALDEYVAARLPDLRLTPAAIDAVALLVAMPLPPRVEFLTPARPGLTALSALAYGSLPAWARDLFPLPAGLEPLHQAAVTAGLRAVRRTGRVLRTVVPAARRGPHEEAAMRRLGLVAA
jgi:uncharacterized protein (DUF2236 family)